MSQLVNMDNFTEDDFYYYVATEEEKAKNSQGISFRDIFNAGEEEDPDRPVPLALKLTDDIERKLGLDEQYTYYIACAYSTRSSGNTDYLKFIEYLFGKC